RTFRDDGDAIILIGESRLELGGSEYLHVLHGLIRGVPPALDLDRERALQQLLVDGAAFGLIQSAHDCAEGGVGVTLAECSFDTGLGASVDLQPLEAPAGFGEIATLFGESASRVIVSVKPQQVSDMLAQAAKANIPAARIGTVGGDRLRLSIAGRQVIDESLHDVEHVWSSAIGSHFEKQRAIA